MSYSDITYTEAERKAKRRRIEMQQIAYDSDLKHNTRDQESAAIELRRIKRDIDRLNVALRTKEAEIKKLQDKQLFLEGESRKLKKELNNLK